MPNVVITTGEAIRERMITYNRFNPQKIISIPTGVDLERFNPEKVRPVLKKEGFLIGMISVLRSWKGHKYLIEAAPKILSHISEAKFFIVGEGPQRGNIERMIQKMDLKEKVIMLGHREDIPEVMASLDVIVHPSTGHEGLPRTILQALAMGKPIIASKVGSISELIKHLTTGILIPSCNSEAIAKAVVEVYKNPHWALQMAQEGQKIVKQHYSYEAMLNKIENIYTTLFS